MPAPFRLAALVAILAATACGASKGSKGSEVDASRSSVSASPESVPADGASAVTLSASARDSSGTVLAGKQAAFVVSGADNALSAETATTDAAGQATITLTSTRAEQKTVRVTIDGVAVAQTATVTFTPRAAARLAFAVEPSGGMAGALFAPAVEVAVEDALGNRVTSGTWSVVLALQEGSGAATLAGGDAVFTVSGVATFTGLWVDRAAAGYTLAASAAGLAGATSAPFEIVPAPPDTGASELAVSPAALAAGETSALTATVRDFYGNAVPGVSITFGATGTGNTLAQPAASSDVLGSASGSLSSAKAESKTVTASFGGQQIATTRNVTFMAGPPSAAGSTLVASPAAAPANGAPVTLTATVGDQYRNPVVGATVLLSSSGAASLVQPSAPTGADGVATGSAGATTVGPQIVTASVGGTAVAIATVAFTGPPSATASTVAVSPSSVMADGTTAALVTVTVRDSAGQALSGQAVSMTYSGTATIVPAAATTDASGVATFQATSSVATSGNLTATVNPGASAVVPSQSPALEFYLPGPFSVGGTVVGLTSAGLVLACAGEPDLPVAAGTTAFAFATKLPSGSAYAVTVKAQPSGQTCAALNASGTVGMANVTSVEVTCSSTGAGGLDASFGTGGVVVTPVTLVGNAYARDMAVQADGKLVVAGEISNGIDSDLAVARFTTDGALDPTFGEGGVVTTRFSNEQDDEAAWAVAVQGDGKIVVAGRYSGNAFALARYTATGALDTTFGTGGKVASFLWPGDFAELRAMAIQADGKIVVAGFAEPGSTWDDFALARFNANGSLDTSFGTGGKVTTPVASLANGSYASNADDGVNALAIQPDGKIVAAGYMHGAGTFHSDDRIAVARYTSSGALDPTFDGDGIAVTQVGIGSCTAAAVAIQGDGKIVVGGSGYGSAGEVDFALVRYAADGTLDASFGGTGKVTTSVGGSGDLVADLRILSDGTILAAGRTSDGSGNVDVALARFGGDGTLDPAFGTGGKVTLAVGTGADYLTGVALTPDGKIAGAGYFWTGLENDWFALRLDAAGARDASFGGDGVATAVLGRGNDQAYAMAVQPDRKIVVVGASGPSQYGVDFAVARYDASGSLDASFGAGGLVVTPAGPGEDRAYAVALQPDGKILAAGFARGASNNDFALARWAADGTLDLAFGTNGFAVAPIGSGNDVANAVALQPDGRIVVAGQAYDGSKDAIAVARFTADGVLDATFGTGGKVITAVGSTFDRGYAVAVQPDGKIVVAGASSSSYRESAALLRYASDGTLDATFGTAGAVVVPLTTSNNHFRALALQPDGKIVAAGHGYVSSWSDFAVARFGPSGALDATFGTGGKVVTQLGFEDDRALAVVLQPDGRIVAAGYATGVNMSIDAALVRYTPSGRLDTTFGTGGKVTIAPGVGTTDKFYALALQADGAILAAGTSGEDLLVARFLP